MLGSLTMSPPSPHMPHPTPPLNRLITEEHAKLKYRERNEVIFLKDDLGCMVPLFRMMEDLDVQVKEWMWQVREMAYDTKDWMDLFLHDQLRRA
jgi:hypothetical protein